MSFKSPSALLFFKTLPSHHILVEVTGKR